MKITADEVDAYLRSVGRKRPWLAELLGVTKSTVGHWLNGTRGIPDPEEKLLRLLIRGELPFHIPHPKHVFQFSPAELKILDVLRLRNGYATIDDYIVAKIRDYLADLAVYDSQSTTHPADGANPSTQSPHTPPHGMSHGASHLFPVSKAAEEMPHYHADPLPTGTDGDEGFPAT